MYCAAFGKDLLFDIVLLLIFYTCMFNTECRGGVKVKEGRWEYCLGENIAILQYFVHFIVQLYILIFIDGTLYYFKTCMFNKCR